MVSNTASRLSQTYIFDLGSECLSISMLTSIFALHSFSQTKNENSAAENMVKMLEMLKGESTI